MKFLLISLFFTHFIGDYALQSRWMGDNKSHNWNALGTHVAVYAAALAIWANIVLGPLDALYFVLLNGALHFITDAITSRATSHFFKAKKMYLTFLVMGFDQFIHAATLILTLPVIFR